MSYKFFVAIQNGDIKIGISMAKERSCLEQGLYFMFGGTLVKQSFSKLFTFSGDI
jgi:hypothetical protein